MYINVEQDYNLGALLKLDLCEIAHITHPKSCPHLIKCTLNIKKKKCTFFPSLVQSIKPKTHSVLILLVGNGSVKREWMPWRGQ